MERAFDAIRQIADTKIPTRRLFVASVVSWGAMALAGALLILEICGFADGLADEALLLIVVSYASANWRLYRLNALAAPFVDLGVEVGRLVADELKKKDAP